MPTVTGEVRDIVGGSMASRVAELVFRLNAPNIGTSGAIASRIIPTAKHTVKPSSDGSFSVDLTQTDILLGDAWYELGIVWNESEGPSWDYPQWQIRVTGSGPLIDMVVMGPPGGSWGGPIGNLSLVLIALTRPPNLQRGQLWLKGDPNDPANNSGDLYRGV